MQKLTLAEIGNPKNTITMMVDDKIEYGYLIENCLSPAQKKKLENFEDICKYGWYSVYGSRRCEVFYGPVYDDTEDETGRFKSGYRVFDAGENWIIYYLTNRQGQRDALYLIPKTKCLTAEDAAREVLLYGGKPIWEGDKIY